MSARSLIRALSPVLLIFVLAGLRLLHPSALSWVWAVPAIDVVVLATVLFAIVAGLHTWISTKNIELRSRRETNFAAIGAIILLATLYIAYAAFRNQTRLNAESYLNNDGMAILNIEVSKPEVRCLYVNYGHDDPDACMKIITEDPQKWSLAILYVEETLNLLQRSKQESKRWGSTYDESLRYWQEDVSQDPTGLFSYYLVSTNEASGLQGAVRDMHAAGVNIATDDLCRNYLKVRSYLISHSVQPKGKVLCALTAASHVPPH